jgi:nucleotide-binding universal stress UspA family protein
VPKTLIVPVDGSKSADRALRCAQRLAAHLGSCDIVVMTASTDPDDRRREHIDRVVSEATETRIRAEFVCGEAAASIVRMAEECSDPLVCMTTRGRSLTAPLLGSVATDVVRGVDTPVVLVGPHCDNDWWHYPAKLVTCWAGEDSNAILAPARQLSEALGMELWLESVVHPLDIQASIDPRHEFAAALAELSGDVEDIRTVVLQDDDTARAIVRSAQEIPATLLAMTTNAGTGIELAVMGSVTTDVVRQSPCPVMVVHGPR